MRRLRLLLVAAVLALGAGLLATATPAVAGPAAPDRDLVVAATCYYEVVWAEVNVRSGPGTDYRIVREKYRGQVVSGTCGEHYYVYRCDTNGACYWWARVYLNTGGYGYMASDSILPV